jgi:hypothetical protein
MASHFARYFAYRRLYVDAIAERAPRRAVLAVVSEVARLGFVAIGAGLFAVIAWALTAGAYGRQGGLVWAFVFGTAAVAITAAVLWAVVSLGRAAADLGRVRRLKGGPNAARKAPGDG